MLYVGNPKGVGRADQRQVIDAVKGLNSIRNGLADDPEIATKIAQYEMAFRMQASVPELVDLKGESKDTLEMYGAKPGDGSFASNCLLARRLAERGVRFIQLYHRGWDHHGGVKNGVAGTAKLVDRASWALVQDLKQRGMLDDTLVIGVESLAARRCHKEGATILAEIITLRGFLFGWPEEELKVV